MLIPEKATPIESTYVSGVRIAQEYLAEGNGLPFKGMLIFSRYYGGLCQFSNS